MSDKNSKTGFIKAALGQRHQEYRLRSLTPVKPILGTSRVNCDGKELINFCSNDYLGLSSHPKVIERSREYSENYGAGSGSSRLVSGTLNIHQELEEKLADVLGLEAVLVFNSGFQANSSILSSLADRNSLILADKKSHNSLIQGALLSNADFKRFNHNDLNHLEKMLRTASCKDYNRIWVVSETVFSMDGDLNDITGLIKLSEKYGALLYSDDAHALGVLGKKGLGLNYGKRGIDLSLGTFGKAFGSFGAFAGCSSEMKDYLINFCPGFIYTTALPPAIIGALDAALELIPEMDSERETLHSNIQYLLKCLKELGFKTGDTDSQIIPIIIGSEEETMNLSNYLEENGIWASAIRPPTVEKDASRIRITITLNHKKEELDQLLEVLTAWKEQ